MQIEQVRWPGREEVLAVVTGGAMASYCFHRHFSKDGLILMACYRRCVKMIFFFSLLNSERKVMTATCSSNYSAGDSNETKLLSNSTQMERRSSHVLNQSMLDTEVDTSPCLYLLYDPSDTNCRILIMINHFAKKSILQSWKEKYFLV